ncbi:Na(+)/H(+) antiporter subunit D [compost metagenome]
MSLVFFLLLPIASMVGVLMAWRQPRVQAWICWGMAIAAMLGAGWLVAAPPMAPYAVGGWPAPFGIELMADGLSRVMVALTGVIFAASATYHLAQTLADAPMTRNPVYHLTFPLLLLALNGLFLTADFFNFYVFFELLAVSSYLLVSLGKHAPLEAAWKYSAQSVLGSVCLLIGTVLLYGETGALGMAEVASRLPGPALWSAPLLLAAFFLKGAVFPFHFWQPDAHAASTTAGSVILAGLLIKVGMYALLRFWPLLLGTELQGIFVVVGAVSIAFGAVAAWRQMDTKRLLGFSSVSQLGFVVLAMGWGTSAALGAAIFYMVAHSLAKALLFLTTGALSDRLTSTRLEALEGAGRAFPWLAGAYLLGVLSLAGFPPTVGFIAKLGVLRAGADAAAWGWVAIVAVGGLLTLAYGGRMFIKLFWRSPVTEGPLRPLGLGHRAAIGGMAALVMGVGLFAQPLYTHCVASGAELLAPPKPAVADQEEAAWRGGAP